jgi:DivIVA domain-containing protein
MEPEFRMARRGYDTGEVDRLLDRIEAAVASTDPAVRRSLAAEIRAATFRVGHRGYDVGDVDRFLDGLADQLG